MTIALVLVILALIAVPGWGEDPDKRAAGAGPARGVYDHFVGRGDTYERIAELKNVDVGALRAMNKDVPLRAGRILRVPRNTAPLRPAK